MRKGLQKLIRTFLGKTKLRETLTKFDTRTTCILCFVFFFVYYVVIDRT